METSPKKEGETSGRLGAVGGSQTLNLPERMKTMNQELVHRMQGLCPFSPPPPP